MSKIDRLGWADGIAFVCQGARIGVRVNDPAILGRLRQHLPIGWKPARSPVVDDLYSLLIGGDDPDAKTRRYNLLYGGIVRLARTLDAAEALETLEQHLYYNVAATAKNRLFVRAGVVGWRGRAIIALAPDKGGTSSLVAALVRSGASYYSDEYAVFDAQGRVHPFPKPMTLPDGGGERKNQMSAQEIGGRVGGKPLPVGLIMVTEYKSGRRWRPRRLSAGEALMALLERSYLDRDRLEIAIATLKRVVDGVSTLKGKRGEAEETAISLIQTCSMIGKDPSAQGAVKGVA